MLRTERLVQPHAIREGDVLATGCRVLERPREAGNGGVWIHLQGEGGDHWVRVASRIPIALQTRGSALGDAEQRAAAQDMFRTSQFAQPVFCWWAILSGRRFCIFDKS